LGSTTSLDAQKFHQRIGPQIGSIQELGSGDNEGYDFFGFSYEVTYDLGKKFTLSANPNFGFKSISLVGKSHINLPLSLEYNIGSIEDKALTIGGGFYYSLIGNSFIGIPLNKKAHIIGPQLNLGGLIKIGPGFLNLTATVIQPIYGDNFDETEWIKYDRVFNGSLSYLFPLF